MAALQHLENLFRVIHSIIIEVALLASLAIATYRFLKSEVEPRRRGRKRKKSHR